MWGCAYCQYMDTGSNNRLPNGQRYKPLHFVIYKTAGVVYLLTCPCGCFYIGETKLEFHKSAYRHVLSMKTCNPDLPLGRHLWDVQGKFPNIKFLILDRVNPSGRGGDWDKILIQWETRWIVSLRDTSPPGLNESVSHLLYLEGLTSGGWKGHG